MIVLVTAGGTTEPIDSVRQITNASTGRLGSLIADSFAADPAVDTVIYLAPPAAQRPLSDRVEFRPVATTADLLATVTSVLGQYQLDAIVHAMAVSDYQVSRVTTAQELADLVLGLGPVPADEVATAIRQGSGLDTSGKLSSHHDDLVLVLRPTPKVIGVFKRLAPQAQLVGFKLLDGVSQPELIDTARRLRDANDCDWVLANDAQDITATGHVGYLLGRDDQVQRFETKADIAAGIHQAVMTALFPSPASEPGRSQTSPSPSPPLTPEGSHD